MPKWIAQKSHVDQFQRYWKKGAEYVGERPPGTTCTKTGKFLTNFKPEGDIAVKKPTFLPGNPHAKARVDLDDMTVAELNEMCRRYSLPFERTTTKQDKIDMIRHHETMHQANPALAAARRAARVEDLGNDDNDGNEVSLNTSPPEEPVTGEE
jgi:hypothetical protein